MWLTSFRFERKGKHAFLVETTCRAGNQKHVVSLYLAWRGEAFSPHSPIISLSVCALKTSTLLPHTYYCIPYHLMQELKKQKLCHLREGFFFFLFLRLLFFFPTLTGSLPLMKSVGGNLQRDFSLLSGYGDEKCSSRGSFTPHRIPRH